VRLGKRYRYDSKAIDGMSTTNQIADLALKPGQSRRKTRQRFSAATTRAYTMVLALAAVWIIFTIITQGVFLEPRNLSNLIRQTAVTGVLSVGMVMVIVAGQIDLSVGSLVGLSGMVAVLVQTELHWGLIASLLTAITVGLGIGALQGWLTAYIQIPSFIVTLGGLLAWRGVAKGISGGNTYPVEIRAFKALGQSYLSPATGIVLGSIAIATITWSVLRSNAARKRHGFEAWGSANLAVRISVPAALIFIFIAVLNSYAGFPIPVLIFLTIALAGAFVMGNTPFGRYLYSIGGNSEAARLSGINLRTHITATFCILGALSGVAGIIYTARVGSAGPDAGTLLELDAIAACVIAGASLMGGSGTVFGACLGALFMTSLDNGMSLKNVPDFIQDIVKGAILVSAVGLDVTRRRGN
jgi:D-xylose transport system permease protein